MDSERPHVSMFSNNEEKALAAKTTLDETDRKILALILIHPKWGNEEIGEEIGLNRIQVWRRRTKGPLSVVLAEFQREALSSASDLVIQEARGAVRILGELARGECDCSPMIREQSDNHRQVCLTPVPYAVRRAAAKDLIEILQSRPKDETETEEDVWEAQVTSVGGISMKKLQGVIDVPVTKEERNEADH